MQSTPEIPDVKRYLIHASLHSISFYGAVNIPRPLRQIGVRPSPFGGETFNFGKTLQDCQSTSLFGNYNKNARPLRFALRIKKRDGNTPLSIITGSQEIMNPRSSARFWQSCVDCGILARTLTSSMKLSPLIPIQRAPTRYVLQLSPKL